MNRLIILLLFQSFIGIVCAQSLKELLIQEDIDQGLLDSYFFDIDTNGNYRVIKRGESNSEYFIYSNTDTIGPLINFSISKMTKLQQSENPNFFYHLSIFNSNMIGPTTSENLSFFRHPISSNKLNEAFALYNGNNIELYLNEDLLVEIDTLTKRRIKINGNYQDELTSKKNNYDSEWASISDNGNIIYKIENNGFNYLYLNSQLIDSSEFGFNGLLVNNNCEYLYFKQVSLGDSIKYHLYKNNTEIGIFSSILNKGKILKNGGYFYSNSYYPTDNILINGNSHFINANVDDLYILDSINYVCLVSDKEDVWLLSNGEKYKLDFESANNPIIDSLGNISVFGNRKGKLYKWTNGNEQIIEKNKKESYFPLYISPIGVEVVLGVSKGSKRIYKSDNIVFESKLNSINVFEHIVNQSQVDNLPRSNSFKYLTIDELDYVLWNGVFSSGIKSQDKRYSDPIRMEFIDFNLNEYGYFIIGKLDNDEYYLLMNNHLYAPLKNISRIFKNVYFSESGLVFFGQKANSIYRFNVSNSD